MSSISEIKTFMYGKIRMLDQNTSQARAANARLRRALGKSPDSTPDVWDITFEGNPERWHSYGDKLCAEQWAVHTTLTLYALHRQSADRSMNHFPKEGDVRISLGTAVGKLVRGDMGRLNAFKRRFDAALTASNHVELAYHIRNLIQLFKSAGDILLDYPQLAVDLYLFQLPTKADNIRLRWGEDFYREISKETSKIKGDVE